MEATLKKLAKGTREEVTELVVDAPVVQVLPKARVHVSLRLPSLSLSWMCQRPTNVSCRGRFTSHRAVPKISSQDRILQSIREQFLDVAVPRMIEQFVDVPKIVFQDRIRQRTFEQFADSPALQVVEEPVFQVSPRTGFNSVLFGRTSNIPWMSPFHKS